MSSRDSPWSGGTPLHRSGEIPGSCCTFITLSLFNLHFQKCSRGGCIRDWLASLRHMNTYDCHVTLVLTLCPSFLFVAPWPSITPGSEYATSAASWANRKPTVADQRQPDPAALATTVICCHLKGKCGWFRLRPPGGRRGLLERLLNEFLLWIQITETKTS